MHIKDLILPNADDPGWQYNYSCKDCRFTLYHNVGGRLEERFLCVTSDFDIVHRQKNDYVLCDLTPALCYFKISRYYNNIRRCIENRDKASWVAEHMALITNADEYRVMAEQQAKDSLRLAYEKQIDALSKEVNRFRTLAFLLKTYYTTQNEDKKREIMIKYPDFEMYLNSNVY